MATNLEMVSFISNPKEGQCQRMFKLPCTCTQFTCQQVMLKILQARLQQYMNQEHASEQPGFRKGRGIRDQIANICWITEKAREFEKNINFRFIDYPKAFDCVDHSKLWKILKEMGILDHLTCLLETCTQSRSNRTRHGTMDWFKIVKKLCQGCI